MPSVVAPRYWAGHSLRVLRPFLGRWLNRGLVAASLDFLLSFSLDRFLNTDYLRLRRVKRKRALRGRNPPRDSSADGAPKALWGPRFRDVGRGPSLFPLRTPESMP